MYLPLGSVMKAIFYSMILICCVPVNATWDFSWESAQSYIPAMPSIELPSISLKPYFGWIFGTACLLTSLACIALIKNNTKYEVAQAKQDAVGEYINNLYTDGFLFNYAGKEASFLCSPMEIKQFNMNISDKEGNEYTFLKVLQKKHGFVECFIDQIMFDHASCRQDYKLLMRFNYDNQLYRFKNKLTIAQLIQNGTLVLVQ